MEYDIKITERAVKDISSLSPKLMVKVKKLLVNVISENPFIGKKLVGELKGNYSYRLSIKDRIIYSVDKNKKVVYIKRARTHYGN